MSNLFGSTKTYLNNVKTLTPAQFGDKVDLFYGHLVSRDEIFAVNMSTDSNESVEVSLAVWVPEDADPQEYFADTIEPIVKDGLLASSLGVVEQVAVPIPA